ncbi:MAG: hypothetical protein P9M03_13025 [Candidatus Theseobacter exili]|nr:hypothetical protein [Candidatus Theseobacter exili]
MPFRKLIFITVAVVFLSYSAHAGTKHNRNVPVSEISIPPNIASINDRFSGDENRHVILIRDLHCNLEAQLNIARTLEIILKNRDEMPAVFVEGAYGKVKTGLYSAFPDKLVRKKITKKFVKEGVVTGPEYFSIVNGEINSFELWGIEDADLYVDNFKAYRETFQNCEALNELTDKLDSLFVRLTESVADTQLKKFIKVKYSFENDEISISKYMQFLKENNFYGIRTSRYPSFEAFINLIDPMESVNFDLVQQEMEKLLPVLAEKLPNEKVAKLLQMSLEYRMGKAGQSSYFSLLDEMIRSVGLTEKYMNFCEYMKVVKEESKIDKNSLFQEINGIQADIRNKLAKSEEEKQLCSFSDDFQVIVRSASLELSRDDYSGFSSKRLFEIVRFCKSLFDFSKSKISLPDKDGILRLATEAKSEMKSIQRFYKLAIKRDSALYRNAILRMNEQEAKTAVVICGGFHTDGLKENFRKKGIGYTVLTPMTSQVDMTAYKSLMMDERIDFNALSFVSQFNVLMERLSPAMKEENNEALINAYISVFLSSHGIPAENSKKVLDRLLDAWEGNLRSAGTFTDKNEELIAGMRSHSVTYYQAEITDIFTEESVRNLLGSGPATAQLTLRFLEEINHPLSETAAEWYAEMQEEEALRQIVTEEDLRSRLGDIYNYMKVYGVPDEVCALAMGPDELTDNFSKIDKQNGLRMLKAVRRVAYNGGEAAELAVQMQNKLMGLISSGDVVKNLHDDLIGDSTVESKAAIEAAVFLSPYQKGLLVEFLEMFISMEKAYTDTDVRNVFAAFNPELYRAEQVLSDLMDRLEMDRSRPPIGSVALSDGSIALPKLIDRMIREPQKLYVIVGVPGASKTTFTNVIMVELFKEINKRQLPLKFRVIRPDEIQEAKDAAEAFKTQYYPNTIYIVEGFGPPEAVAETYDDLVEGEEEVKKKEIVPIGIFLPYEVALERVRQRGRTEKGNRVSDRVIIEEYSELYNKMYFHYAACEYLIDGATVVRIPYQPRRTMKGLSPEELRGFRTQIKRKQTIREKGNSSAAKVNRELASELETDCADVLTDVEGNKYEIILYDTDLMVLVTPAVFSSLA